MKYEINDYFGDKKICSTYPQVLAVIREFMKNNQEALNTPLYATVQFGDSYHEKFIRAFKIDFKDFKRFAKTHDILSQGWIIVNDPVNLALYLGYVHSGKREYIDFLAMKFMTSQMYKYYDKDGGLNSDIMRFIVEGVDNNGKPIMSNRWLLKTEGSTVRYVKAIVDTYINEHLKGKYKNKNLNEDDILIANIHSLSDRLNGSMRKIRDLYARYAQFRMYEQGDVIDQDTLISVENESAKLNTLRSLISESIISGMDVTSLKRVGGSKFYNVMSIIYDEHRSEVLDYCKYLVDFYLEKRGLATFTGMNVYFVDTVTKAKGRDDSLVTRLIGEYGIKDRSFNKVFLEMHVILIRGLIGKIGG